MAQHLEQTQEAIQTQQLSLLQVAVAKIMELPVTELATRVRDEMLENAALEESDPSDPTLDEPASSDPSEETDPSEEGEDTEGEYRPDEGEDTRTDETADYLQEDDIPEYLRQRAEAQSEEGTFQYAATHSFYESLRGQIGEHDLSPHEQEVMEYLIGSLTDDGYLLKTPAALCDELAIYHGIDTNEDEVGRLVSVLQTFEPRGIGARSLQECLHLQLADPERRNAHTDLALTVVDKYFKQFTSRHWDVIRERLHTDDATFEAVIREITRLNPRPGSALGEAFTGSAPAVVPDFYLTVSDEGDIRIALNHGEVPELRISPAFKSSLKQYAAAKAHLSREQKEAYVYAKQKVESANQFLNLIHHRNQTLLAVMRHIAERQREFFLNDDDESMLHPLILKEIAEKVGINISTISRAVSNKYVQTAYGTYPLKYFFSTQFTTEDGDELSARKVKAALRELIEGEDKRHPLSDELLAERLKAQGFNVARRTVAKYRDMLGLPTARLRRDRLA